jgi:hypothetical protein
LLKSLLASACHVVISVIRDGHVQLGVPVEISHRHEQGVQPYGKVAHPITNLMSFPNISIPPMANPRHVPLSQRL